MNGANKENGMHKTPAVKKTSSGSGSNSGSGQRPITSFFNRTPAATIPRESTVPTLTSSGVKSALAGVTALDFDNVVNAKSKRSLVAVQFEEDLDEEIPASRSKKSRTIREDSDDERDADFAPPSAEQDDDDDAAPVNAVDDDEEEAEAVGSDDDDDAGGSSKKRKRKDELKTPSTKRRLDVFRAGADGSSSPSVFGTTPTGASKLSNRQSLGSFAAPSTEKKKERAEKFKENNKERYAFLLDERDEQKRRPGDEGYDPRTLFIPPSAWDKFTQFEKQFWEVKSKHWDTVVFFKKGKFYELYEKDADIAHQEFDWKVSDRVNMKMCGAPENSFQNWAAQFVAKGYKVARVDQVETLIGKEMREKTDKKKKGESSIIRRELTTVLTAGTLVDSSLICNDMGTYCMSIKEEVGSAELPPSFGICFVDTATAEFKISAFLDDVDRSKFETLLLQLKPRELVLEKGKISPQTMRVIKNSCLAQFNFLEPESEFWNYETTISEMQQGDYFPVENGKIVMPYELENLISETLGISACGALMSYLKTLKLDKELVSVGNFKYYDPICQSGTLVLDGKTLVNLEIFQNTVDGSESGKELCGHFSKMPDLERIISRIHAGTCKVKDFIAALKAFSDILAFGAEMKKLVPEFKSARLTAIAEEGFPEELQEQLQYFNNAFDHSESKDDLVMNDGYDAEYDEANLALRAVEDELERYRKDQSKQIGKKLVYKDMGKDLFQLECAAGVTVPKSWKQQSKTKQVTRWYTTQLEEIIRRFLEAREIKGQAWRTVRGRVYARFDKCYSGWLRAAKSVAELDCLLNLYTIRGALGSPVCRPMFKKEGKSFLEVEELRHPCIVPDPGRDFIPNDTSLGGDGNYMILLTGPNMGGKSTLLRQLCIAVIMAQMGCYVPASSCRMTTFDRIFTRLGANDNILKGESTFMVELSETSRILREATSRSLVVLDELGRGTSTFDGYAIAFAVLHHLVTRSRCLGLFSTHYGMLTREFEDNSLVSLNFMNFVSNEERREVTFLYKLTKGVCPFSFGMNVASMAGVPHEIVDRADEIAAKFEVDMKLNQVRDCSLATGCRAEENGFDTYHSIIKWILISLGLLLGLIGIIVGVVACTRRVKEKAEEPAVDPENPAENREMDDLK
ncbi:DNA mismatch repair protein msh6 [Irineochytrium annulatum]|nr:DNA mismatch repair protein msh6 [Irineochytrium annulatum]